MRQCIFHSQKHHKVLISLYTIDLLREFTIFALFTRNDQTCLLKIRKKNKSKIRQNRKLPALKLLYKVKSVIKRSHPQWKHWASWEIPGQRKHIFLRFYSYLTKKTLRIMLCCFFPDSQWQCRLPNVIEMPSCFYPLFMYTHHSSSSLHKQFRNSLNSQPTSELPNWIMHNKVQVDGWGTNGLYVFV